MAVVAPLIPDWGSNMAKVQAKLNPQINVPGWAGFLLWARQEQPAIYSQLVTEVPAVASFESAYQNAGLGDISDWFSGLGDTLSSAGSSIMSAITTIAPAALTLGTSLIQSKSQQNLLNTQLKLAQINAKPAQTTTIQTANGPITVPATMNAAGQYVPVTGSTSGFMATLSAVPMTTWLLVGGVLLTTILLLRRKA